MQNAGTPTFLSKKYSGLWNAFGTQNQLNSFQSRGEPQYSHLPNPALEIVLTAPQLEHLPILEPVNVVVILSVAALGTATTADLGKTNSLRCKSR